MVGRRLMAGRKLMAGRRWKWMTGRRSIMGRR